MSKRGDMGGMDETFLKHSLRALRTWNDYLSHDLMRWGHFVFKKQASGYTNGACGSLLGWSSKNLVPLCWVIRQLALLNIRRSLCQARILSTYLPRVVGRS